ncbi:MAG TPA: hypothetical protein P5155_01860 [Candidatus Absconditabacterales bacterium]|nr:hypothetical protein [Candidatus Absconditabacterales bacterium]
MRKQSILIFLLTLSIGIFFSGCSTNSNPDDIKKSEDSVAFYAFGEEPFWSFTLKNESLYLSTPDTDREINHRVIVEQKDGTYEIFGEVIEAKIRPEPCQDGGIGDMHDYSVSISYEPESIAYGCADAL